MWGYTLLAIVLLHIHLVSGQARTSRVVLDNNGFDGIVIGIHPDVKEHPDLLTKIKEKFTQASEVLYTATHRRAFFRDITIVLPHTWGNAASATGFQLYQDADVVIEPGPTTAAYTLMFKGCGQKGSHIRLEANLFTDPSKVDEVGPIEKLIVHEWGHFRWGLFNEYNSGPYDTYFRNPITGKSEATRCSERILGRDFDIQNGRYVGLCFPDKVTGNYGPNCVFQPYLGRYATVKNRGVRASMMDRTFAQNIEVFCRSQTNPRSLGPGEVHYAEAPTKHNRMCGGQSTMDVILQSEDFMDPKTKTPLNPVRNVPYSEFQPKFKIQQADNFRHIFALDTPTLQKSLEGVYRARRAVHTLVRNSPASMRFDLNTADAYMSNLSSRDLIDVTNRVLQNASRTSSVKSLEEQLDNVFKRRLSGRVNVLTGIDHTSGSIGVGNNVPVNVISLADDQGATRDDGVTEASDDYFTEHSMYNLVGRELREKFMLLRENVHVSGLDEVIIPIYVDKAVRGGLEADVRFHGSLSPEVNLINVKTGTPYPFPHGSCVEQGDTRLLHCSFATYILEEGSIGVSIRNKNKKADRIAITLSAIKSALNSQPLDLTAWTGDSVLSKEGECLSVYGEVSVAGLPVSNLSVSAIIHDRSARIYHSINLLDSGAGLDIEVQDGIYSRAFCNFTSKGKYTVTVNVSNKNGTAFIPVSRYDQIRADFGPVKYRRYSEPVIRVALAGSVTYGVEVNTTDQTPPAQITDATLIQLSGAAREVTISWTATGDDLDVGTADHYEVRVSESAETLRKTFYKCYQLQSSDITEGSLDEPLPSGYTEMLTFRAPQDVDVKYLALRSIDDNNNKALISNVVPVGFTEGIDYNTNEHSTSPQFLVDVEEPSNKQSGSVLEVAGPVAGVFITLLLVAGSVLAIIRRARRIIRIRDSLLGAA